MKKPAERDMQEIPVLLRLRIPRIKMAFQTVSQGNKEEEKQEQQ
jgi:hypothetical protein